MFWHPLLSSSRRSWRLQTVQIVSQHMLLLMLMVVGLASTMRSTSKRITFLVTRFGWRSRNGLMKESLTERGIIVTPGKIVTAHATAALSLDSLLLLRMNLPFISVNRMGWFGMRSRSFPFQVSHSRSFSEWLRRFFYVLLLGQPL